MTKCTHWIFPYRLCVNASWGEVFIDILRCLIEYTCAETNDLSSMSFYEKEDLLMCYVWIDDNMCCELPC